MGATNLQNGDEITYKKILMFISMTMITSQKCRVINENLHIRGTISVKSVATYLWSQLTYDHKRRISLTWKVSHKLRQEKWNPKLKFQTGRPPIDFIFKPVPIPCWTSYTKLVRIYYVSVYGKLSQSILSPTGSQFPHSWMGSVKPTSLVGNTNSG